MSKIYQVSTLDALMQGYFNGSVTVKELLKHGSYGIGTFEGLDGEMIVQNGKVFDGRSDGNVYPMSDDELIAFTTVYDFTANALKFTADDLKDLDAVKAYLDSIIEKNYNGNKNVFYIMNAEGVFDLAKVRSCSKQQAPYPTLAEVAKCQKENTYSNEEGYLQAIWCPQYINGINLPGWHIHYLSKDFKHGGHVLNLAIKSIALTFDQICSFDLNLPTNEAFGKVDLLEDLSSATASVEGDTGKK